MDGNWNGVAWWAFVRYVEEWLGPVILDVEWLVSVGRVLARKDVVRSRSGLFGLGMALR